MKKVVISGDIIAFTSLSVEEKLHLKEKIEILINILRNKFETYTRIIKGDYIECIVYEPKEAIRIALIIKSYIKFIINENNFKSTIKRKKYHQDYGIRLALGLGELNQINIEKGIIDGEAIYISGRLINEENTHKGKKIHIRNTMFFGSDDKELNIEINTIIQLIDFIINKSTGKQCEVLFYKLLNFNEEEISKKINVSQPVINKHSTNIGWGVIESSIKYMQNKIN